MTEADSTVIAEEGYDRDRPAFFLLSALCFPLTETLLFWYNNKVILKKNELCSPGISPGLAGCCRLAGPCRRGGRLQGFSGRS